MSATSSAADALAMMEEHLVSATLELFGAYDLGAEQRPAGLGAPEGAGAFVVSVIGFAGDGVRGALVLSAPPAAVHVWMRAVDAEAAPGDLCDTTGEFSNMLLGRLKTKLLREGLPLLVSTPTTAIGLSLGSAASGAISKWFAFADATWSAAVRLDVTFDHHFSLCANVPLESAAEAGDMMMF